MSMDRLVVVLAVGGIVLFVFLPTLVVLLTSEKPPIKNLPPSPDRGGRPPGRSPPTAGR
jgi:hypothetical protein